jgi:hypothetical protein
MSVRGTRPSLMTQNNNSLKYGTTQHYSILQWYQTESSFSRVFFLYAPLKKLHYGQCSEAHAAAACSCGGTKSKDSTIEGGVHQRAKGTGALHSQLHPCR